MAGTQENYPDEPRILIADSSMSWRDLLHKTLDSSGIYHESVRSAEAAIERLGRDDEYRISGVVSDAFPGAWQEVAQAAQNVGARIVLMTRSRLTAYEADLIQVPVRMRNPFEQMTCENSKRIKAVLELVRVVMPQPIPKK